MPNILEIAETWNFEQQGWAQNPGRTRSGVNRKCTSLTNYNQWIMSRKLVKVSGCDFDEGTKLRKSCKFSN